MKALVYNGAEQLSYSEVPDPVCNDNEHLVKVEAVGICGSDMHAYLGHDERRPAPLILGHEAAGTIVGGPCEGERVTINPLVTCGTCKACQSGRENLCPNRQIISMPPREGAFAQYVGVPEENLVTVPDHVSLVEAALTEPLAVSWHAIKLGLSQLHPKADRKALVLGGGAIGMAAALALQAHGVEDVTMVKPNKDRRSFLQNQCGQNAISSADGTFSLVIDAVGYEATRKAASQVAEPGGVIVHVGLGDNEGGLDIRRMTLQEITFIGTYTYSAEDFRECAQAIFDGRLGDLDWFVQRPLAEGQTVFRELRQGTIAAPKVILDPFA